MKRIIFSLTLGAAAMMASAFSTDTIQVPTKYLDSPESVVVVTPNAAAAGVACPTVYLLNGFSGNHLDWTTRDPELGTLADQYGVIVVMPDGRDSWYFDSPVDPKMQMESFFVRDLVPYIDSHYPTRAEAQQRAITGLSMGGHGSLWLAMHHPDIWASGGSMSGGVDFSGAHSKFKIAERIGSAEEYPERWEQMMVVNNVPMLKDSGINIIFDCGVDDFLVEGNKALHAKLVEAGVPHDYSSRPGKHTWDYWRNSLPYHLLYFSKIFGK